jgi:hypothetical protein
LLSTQRRSTTRPVIGLFGSGRIILDSIMQPSRIRRASCRQENRTAPSIRPTHRDRDHIFGHDRRCVDLCFEVALGALPAFTGAAVARLGTGAEATGEMFMLFVTINSFSL